jgi:hypothetical protein
MCTDPSGIQQASDGQQVFDVLAWSASTTIRRTPDRHAAARHDEDAC